MRVDHDRAGPAVTPIYQTSAFIAGSPYFYSRKNNPNVAELEQVVGMLEGAEYCIAVATGMAAVSSAIELVEPGDIVVVNCHVYGCSFKLFQRLSKRRRFDLIVLDLSQSANLSAIPDNVRMVFFETPTNPFLNTISIRHVADEAKSRSPRALIVVDNTWATPMYQHPLEHGADVSLHSGTKYFSGHSDVMSGVLLTNRKDLSEEFYQSRFYGGAVIAPHSAWLTRRSLQTLQVRLRHQERVTQQLCEFLSHRPEVERVYYPHIDGDQLTGYGGILFFDLREDLVGSYPALAEALALFEAGTGMAAVTSTVAQPYTGSHASLTEQEKEAIGLSPQLIRLCFGLEEPDDLVTDLATALSLIEERTERLASVQ
jgi:cystathionine gamma-lyase/cystathionine gamma-lyase/homocysteine desulfhydrase